MHAVEGISNYLGIQVAATVTLLHEALLNYVVADHVENSKFVALSSPKEKHRTPSGQEHEGAKANHPVYSSVGRETAMTKLAS